MSTTNIVVGNITPLVLEEIQALDGKVRLLSKNPRLYLVQLPHQPWVSPSPINLNSDIPVDPTCITNDIEIGEKEGSGYLLLRSDGWMCEYHQHPSDLTQTWLRSYQDTPLAAPSSEDNEKSVSYGLEHRENDDEVNRLDLWVIQMLKDESLTLYEQHIWKIAKDPTSFANRPDLRLGLLAHITGSSYTSPAVREAVAAIEEEISTLDEEAAHERIADIVNEVLGEAEVIMEELSDKDARTISHFELTYRLEALRSGMLTEKEIKRAVEEFGEAQFLEAQADVEQLLGHINPAIRCSALDTLIMSWGLTKEHTETAFRFSTDPDPECKQRGLRCLNPEGNPLFDLRVLQTYAQVAANPDELASTRKSAYSELLMATGYPCDDDRWQELETSLDAGGAFEQAPGIDWELIRFILANPTEALTLVTTLTFLRQEENWQDQQGQVFSSIDDLSWDILRRGHHIIRTRLPKYALTITFAPVSEL